MKEVGRERKRKKNWIFRVNELPELSSIKAEHQHLSQVRFYFTGPQVKQLLMGYYFCCFAS